MILVVILYAVFAAMTFINSLLMISNPYPLFVGMLRALGSSTILLTYAFMVHRESLLRFSLDRKGWKHLIIYGITIHAIVMCGFSIAVMYTDPVNVCFIVAATPFITAFMQYLAGEERLTRKKTTGLIVGLSGLIPILLLSNESSAYKNIPLHLELFGNLVTLLSIIVFSYGWVVMKKFLKRYPNEQLEVLNGISMLIGGVASAAFFLTVRGPSVWTMKFTASFPVLAIAFIVSSTITYMLYLHLLRKFSPTFIAFAGFLEPAFGLIYGALFMGYSIGVMSILALATLFMGLHIYYVEEKKTA